MPLVTLTLHAFMALIMDLDSPEASRNRYLVVMEALVWNIGAQGFLQPIAALIVALIICPIISFTILTGKILFDLKNLFLKSLLTRIFITF